MALKILLLAAAAVAVWMLSRPRIGERKKRGKRGIAETAMTRCAKCGVYHPADESCACEDR
ncbi:MAG: hypothetical protein ACR2QC_05095 [Gammaproteobacteria bacterium]